VVVLALALLLAASTTGQAHPGTRPGNPGVAQDGLALRRYVLASVANVRQAPSGPVLFRLRVNTPVLQHASSRGWSQVSWQSTSLSPLWNGTRQGFIRTQLLAEQPLELKNALAWSRHAARAGRSRKAIVWAERAFAVDGNSRNARDALVAAYRAAGDRARAARLGRMLSGNAPAYLAVCRDGAVELLAASAPRGVLRPVQPDPWVEPQPLVRDLGGGSTWYSLSPHGQIGYVSAGEFAGPHYVASVDRMPATWQAGNDGEGRRLVLAPCAQEGTLYATAPLGFASHYRDLDTPRSKRVLDSLDGVRRAGGWSQRGLTWATLGSSLVAVAILESGKGRPFMVNRVRVYRVDRRGHMEWLSLDLGYRTPDPPAPAAPAAVASPRASSVWDWWDSTRETLGLALFGWLLILFQFLVRRAERRRRDG